MDIKIERGIPIFPKRDTLLEEKFPEFLALELGDSFVIPKDKFPMQITIALWGIKKNQRHEIRELDNGDFRVWRTK